MVVLAEAPRMSDLHDLSTQNMSHVSKGSHGSRDGGSSGTLGSVERSGSKLKDLTTSEDTGRIKGPDMDPS